MIPERAGIRHGQRVVFSSFIALSSTGEAPVLNSYDCCSRHTSSTTGGKPLCNRCTRALQSLLKACAHQQKSPVFRFVVENTVHCISVSATIDQPWPSCTMQGLRPQSNQCRRLLEDCNFWDAFQGKPRETIISLTYRHSCALGWNIAQGRDRSCTLGAKLAGSTENRWDKMRAEGMPIQPRSTFPN